MTFHRAVIGYIAAWINANIISVAWVGLRLSFDLFVLQALQREDSYEETIRDLTARLKDVSFQRFYQQESRAVAGNPRDAAVIFDP